MVWEAYQRVRANKGAPGVDGVTIEQFEQDLQGNLYKLWNRMSSGSYFPPAVKGVEIPKAGGRGVRLLGVPAVGDRVAQTVAAMALEARTESIFHDGLLWLPAPARRAGCGGEMPPAVLEERLGD
jgi:retron-type reverse transcriptase